MPPIPPALLARVRSILVCQLRQIGDVLLCTPSLRLLRERFPDAAIHLFTEARCAPMVEHNPRLAAVWGVDKKELRSLRREVAFYWKVARQGFDLVVDFQQLPRCRWVVAFSGARVRLSYPPPAYNRLLYTHWHTPPQGYAAMAKAGILAPLGIEWRGEAPELYLLAREREAAGRLLHGLGARPESLLVSVDPTHRRPSRAWPLEHWGRLLALFGARRPEAVFLLHHGPGEEEAVRQVRRVALEAGLGAERVLLPERVLRLREMAACIGQARLHLGNCSAPRHMAVALGVPSVTVLGATSWAWTFPAPEHTHVALCDLRELPCQPCNRNTCTLYERPRCLYELTPETVLDKVLEHAARVLV